MSRVLSHAQFCTAIEVSSGGCYPLASRSQAEIKAVDRLAGQHLTCGGTAQHLVALCRRRELTYCVYALALTQHLNQKALLNLGSGRKMRHHHA